MNAWEQRKSKTCTSEIYGNSATSPGHGPSSALLKQKSPESKKNNATDGDIDDGSNVAVMSFLQSLVPSYSNQKSKVQPASRTRGDGGNIGDDNTILNFLRSIPSTKNKHSKSNAISVRGESFHANSSESKGPWTDKEHCTFLEGLYAYGKDWIQIAALVKSRNAEEVQHYFHSFQKEESFIFTLRRMLDDQSLVHIIAWLSGGRTFRIYNKLTFMRIPALLYFNGFFLDFDHFQTKLYSYGFNQNSYNGAWFHAHFWRASSFELKKHYSKNNVCNNRLCKKTGSLMQCTGCRKVYYCSLACQHSDWNVHMLFCGYEQSSGEWSTEEHNRFLEGLEQHGRSWKHVAFHVKTRTAEQVNGYGYRYLKKTNCYWTSKEHQLFLKGLQQYGRGRWVEIATHVGTKNKEQVSFHAHEYFEKEEMNKESQKMTDGSDEHSQVARKLVKKPNHNLINVTSRNAKRSIDEAGDSISTSSKKRITKESNEQKNDEQRIVTPEKDTGLEGNMQSMVNSTNSLKSVHQKKTDPQNENEATGNNLLQESNELCDKSTLLSLSNKDSYMQNKGKWTNEGRRLFIEGLELYGKKISASAPDDIDDTSCPICLEKLNDPHIVPECCHRFCKGCIEEALQYRRECPICRSRVTSRRSLRRDEVFGKILRLLEIERAKANANISTRLQITNVDVLSNVSCDNHQTEVGEKKEIINFLESFQTYMKEKEQTQLEMKDNENIRRNENIEVILKGDAINDQLQHDGRAKTQLKALEKQIEQNEEELKRELQEKNEKIQLLESKQKADEEKLQNMAKQALVIKDLENQLKEKNARIQTLENLVGTLSHDDKELHSCEVPAKE